MEYIIVVLLITIAILLVNIHHFCKGIKRDLFEIKTRRKWDDEDSDDGVF